MNDTFYFDDLYSGGTATSTATSTMWYSIDGDGTSSATSDTSYRALKNRDSSIREHTPVSGHSITYDPEKKRYEVSLSGESFHSTRYFKTKRSALRFVKRHEQGRPKKVDVLTKMKAKNEQNKIRIAEEAEQTRLHEERMERLRIQAAERAERDRLARAARAEQMILDAEAREAELERLELDNEEDNYFERLGL